MEKESCLNGEGIKTGENADVVYEGNNVWN